VAPVTRNDVTACEKGEDKKGGENATQWKRGKMGTKVR
jgi:hypothetical protein